MTAQEAARRALNRLAKWRTVLAGWQLGTRPDTDPKFAGSTPSGPRNNVEHGPTFMGWSDTPSLTAELEPRRQLPTDCDVKLERHPQPRHGDRYRQSGRDDEGLETVSTSTTDDTWA